jgi:hypothetical protein
MEVISEDEASDKIIDIDIADCIPHEVIEHNYDREEEE